LPWVEIYARYFSGADQTLHVNTQTATVEAFLLVANDEIQFKMHKPEDPSLAREWCELYPDNTTQADVVRAVEDPVQVQPGVYHYNDSQINRILSTFFQRAQGVPFIKVREFGDTGFQVHCLPHAVTSCTIYPPLREKDNHSNDTLWRPAKACLIDKDGMGQNIVLRNKNNLTTLLEKLEGGLFSFPRLKSEMPTPSWPHIMQSIEQRLDRIMASRTEGSGMGEHFPRYL
jgi:hypothetical protein